MVQMGKVAMVMRVITTTIPNFEDLKVPPVLKDVIMTKRGLVLVVGGTGSGKSTTLAAMIGYRNANQAGHIITIEDPVEYVHPHNKSLITQREVGVDTESWEAALKNTLRQAPDVILIGEIRDMEVMEHAIAFAETGHLALGTLHANNSNQAMDRIINFFPEARRHQLLMDLSLNLKAVISQRLIPVKEGKGRAAAVEVLLNSPLISDLIFKGEIHGIKEIMKKSKELGMQTFDQAWLRKPLPAAACAARSNSRSGRRSRASGIATAPDAARPPAAHTPRTSSCRRASSPGSPASPP
jgi:twitching motility protein PilU